MESDIREDLKINMTKITYDKSFNRLRLMKIMVGRRLKTIWPKV